MILKVMSVLIVSLLVLSGSVFMLNSLSREPVELKVNYLEPESSEIIEYGAVPIFAEKMRFSRNLISYYIGDDCDEIRRDDMISAFNIFSREVKIVSFYEGSADADIKIECSNEFVTLSDSLFAAGEGGPSRIINTSGFKVIEEGTILLYKGGDCGYPIVALHELGHVFGFAHSDDPSNIMYNISRCDQRMSRDMTQLMQELYSIEPLADAKVEAVSAVIRGRYLDFNISILNEGLSDIDDIGLAILIDGEDFEVVEIGGIEVGYGRTLRVENMRIPRSVEKVEFVVDIDNLIPELNEENNAVELIV